MLAMVIIAKLAQCDVTRGCFFDDSEFGANLVLEKELGVPKDFVGCWNIGVTEWN